MDHRIPCDEGLTTVGPITDPDRANHPWPDNCCSLRDIATEGLRLVQRMQKELGTCQPPRNMEEDRVDYVVHQMQRLLADLYDLTALDKLRREIFIESMPDDPDRAYCLADRAAQYYIQTMTNSKSPLRPRPPEGRI